MFFHLNFTRLFFLEAQYKFSATRGSATAEQRPCEFCTCRLTELVEESGRNPPSLLTDLIIFHCSACLPLLLVVMFCCGRVSQAPFSSPISASSEFRLCTCTKPKLPRFLLVALCDVLNCSILKIVQLSQLRTAKGKCL